MLNSVDLDHDVFSQHVRYDGAQYSPGLLLVLYRQIDRQTHTRTHTHTHTHTHTEFGSGTFEINFSVIGLFCS